MAEATRQSFEIVVLREIQQLLDQDDHQACIDAKYLIDGLMKDIQEGRSILVIRADGQD